MNRPVPRAEVERFTATLAEKRRRLAKAEQSTRGYRDEDGVWQGGLLAFVRYFWHVLEPGTPFVGGFAIEAVVEHLEAVTFGEITKLLINIPPGFAKSLITDVFFPAWEHGPMNMPHIRYVAFSYSATLTERDNLKFRDLMACSEYQSMYPHVKLRQDGARKVSNTSHGWKLASSVGGVGTGERGDRIICLPYSEPVLTSSGWLPIGQIVQSRLDVSIAGLDHENGLAWQSIEAFEENTGGELVEIKYEGGALKCTVDHPVYVHGRGYVRADSIQTGETLWAYRQHSVQGVRSSNSSQAVTSQILLQQSLREFLQDSAEHDPLHCLRQNGLRSTSASCSPEGAMLLRSQMPRSAQSGAKHASCPPHRLREGKSRPDELDNRVQILPWRNARPEGVPRGLDGKTVISVERIGRAERTFNIRVHPCHNYFASGVLIHNCDDPHNVKESESETVRNETIRWFRESMSSRLNNMETGAKIVIMQRVNEEDVAGTIIREMEDYCILMIPMEYIWDADENGEPYSTSIGWVDPRWRPDADDCEGELAWPERFPESIIPSMKREGTPYSWAAQYQQIPSPRGGGIFQLDWWMPAEAVMAGSKYPPFSYIVASLDGAFTEKEENDPSGLTVWGVFENEYGYNRVVLIDAWRKRLPFSGPKIEVRPNEHESLYIARSRPHWGLVEWVAYTCNFRKVDRLLIEAKASGISAAQSLGNSHGKSGWAIELIDPKGDKVARAMSVVGSFAQEMIYAPDREWAAMVKEEMGLFPHGKHDDLTDSATQAIKHLRDTGLIRSDEERRAEEINAVRHKGPAKRVTYPGMRRLA